MPTFQRPAAGGWLVRSNKNAYGTGKVVALSGGSATVEYFVSVSQRIRHELPVGSLTRVRVAPQTRCYLLSVDDGRWRVGRVKKRYDQDYEIDLPDVQSLYISEEYLYVRCSATAADPTETLIARAHETSFFHATRTRFVRSILKQRAGFRGLTALASAGIELFPHQVEVVRRVLEDPIQRYLLADEVGLGKTIEAGIIIRQFLLDEGHGRVVVAAPPVLVKQWQDELVGRFDALSSGRVTVCAVDELTHALGDAVLGLMVLDEAHHLSSWAYSEDNTRREQYCACARLAHRSERLLLLSATPAANHEQQFLAMLHLLDPLTYRLEDLEAFRLRVEKRQPIGRLLLGFTEDADPFAVKMSLERLTALLPEDAALAGLASELAAALSNGTADARIELIRSIRAHIGETYRLHRRMLRSRRSELDGGTLAVRGEEGGGSPLVISNPDERVRDAHDLIDEWRAYAASYLEVHHGVDDEGNAEKATLELLLLLLSCTVASMSLLREVVHWRLSGQVSDHLRGECGRGVERCVSDAPRFEGERDILRRLLAVAESPGGRGDGIAVIAARLRDLREHAGSRRPPRCVVFAPSAGASGELALRLSEILGRRAVAQAVGDSERAALALAAFRDDHDCFVLVCERGVEEGINLQFADELILCDLPWSPNQLEQRIGRVDRIGRTRPVRISVLVPDRSPVSIYAAWLEMLRDGLGAFHRSIASLQFFITDRLAALHRTLLHAGTEGLRAQVEMVRQDVERERIRIDEQSALDEIEASYEHTSRFFTEMEDVDADCDRMKEEVEAWACAALRFTREESRLDQHVLKYESDTGTLVPSDLVARRFSAQLGQKVTYRRTVAALHPGVRLLRIGNPLIDALWEYVQWDDRGQTFAIWRRDEGWDPAPGAEWVGFRIQYLVEANAESLERVLAERGLPAVMLRPLRRNADALFSPSVETLYYDVAGQQVSDPAFLRVLRKRIWRVRDGGTDTNLTKARLGLLDAVVEADRWEWACRTVRERSEAAVRGRDNVRGRIEAALDELKRRTTTLAAQLRARAEVERCAAIENAGSSLREAKLQVELGAALAEGIQYPSLRVDSIGCIVISGRHPTNVVETDD